MGAQHSVELMFDPVHHLTRGGRTESSAEFESLGDDPNFDVTCTGGLATIRPGWWRVRGHLAASDGWIISPRFYADHGQGFNEPDTIALLEPGAAGLIDCVAYVKAPLLNLRFDPTVRQATFQIALALTPLSRPQAVARMLEGIGRARFGSWRTAAAAFGELLRDCMQKTPSAGAQTLLQSYRQAHAVAETSYDAWWRLYEPLHSEMSEHASRGLSSMQAAPEIAIVLQVHQPDQAALRRCLDSVVAQTWPRWHLWVAVDPATSRSVRALLGQYAAAEPRISILSGRVEAQPVGSTEMLPEVKEDYVGFLEQDARLAPNALCEIAHAIDADRNAGFFYTDADGINRDGHRVDPRFKPNWNPSLLLAQDYVGHFSVVRTALLRDAGGLRMEAKEWHHDLTLRCTSQLAKEQVCHIPKVLYHARGEPRAGNRNQEGMVHREAVRVHLSRGRVPAHVIPLPDGRLRVTPSLPKPAPLVTIIVPTRDRVELLRACVESVHSLTRYPRFEILVVDNGSVEPETLEYLDRLRQHPGCRVLPHPAPFNFSAITNAGAEASLGEILCLLNNDIEVISEEWLDNMVAHATLPDAGVVGAMLYYPDDTIQHAGVMLGIGGVAGHAYHRSARGCPGHQGRAQVAQEMSAVTGACMVVRHAVFRQVGGFDEGLPVAFNDIDFCLRVLQSGYRNVWTPHAELYHHESVSRGHEDTPEKRARFASEVETMKRRWGDFLADDPAYNPNLTLDGSQFQLSFPPRIKPFEIYRQRVIAPRTESAPPPALRAQAGVATNAAAAAR